MDTERKMGYINERKRQQRREHKLRKFTTIFLIYWVGFSLTIMIFFKYKINELYELNRKTQLQIELLKEQLNNYNEKDIRARFLLDISRLVIRRYDALVVCVILIIVCT